MHDRSEILSAYRAIFRTVAYKSTIPLRRFATEPFVFDDQVAHVKLSGDEMPNLLFTTGHSGIDAGRTKDGQAIHLPTPEREVDRALPYPLLSLLSPSSPNGALLAVDVSVCRRCGDRRAARPKVRPSLADGSVMRRGRVLIVDDEPYVRNGVERLLRGEFDTVIANDGEEALMRIEDQERFHVIICDVQMDRISGPSFRDSVRRVAPHLADRIIFLTGCADEKLQNQIQDHMVLTKPFIADDLRQLVRRVASAVLEGYFPRRIVEKRSK